MTPELRRKLDGLFRQFVVTKDFIERKASNTLHCVVCGNDCDDLTSISLWLDEDIGSVCEKCDRQLQKEVLEKCIYRIKREEHV